MKGEMYIVCRNSDTKGVINFYVTAGSESYFLFQQKFRHSAYEYYLIPQSSQLQNHKKQRNYRAFPSFL